MLSISEFSCNPIFSDLQLHFTDSPLKFFVFSYLAKSIGLFKRHETLTVILQLSYDCVRCDEEKILNEIVERSQDNLNPEQKQVMRKVIESSKGNLEQNERQILEEIVRSSNGKLKQEDLVVDVSTTVQSTSLTLIHFFLNGLRMICLKPCLTVYPG